MLNHLQDQNPSFLSLPQIQVAYNLCKWGALLLAVLATFRTITKTLNLLIITFRQNPPSIPLLTDDDDDFSDTDDDDDDDDETTSSSSSEFEDEDRDHDARCEYFPVRGDEGLLRRRSIGDLFSLSEIANTKSVVKLWDTIGFGLAFGFDRSQQETVVSLYNQQQRTKTTPPISCSSPAVVVSAGENASGNLALRIWDTRLRRRTPAVIAEWGPTLGLESGRYGLTVGDIRNVRSPLENVTESHVDTWWPNSFMLKI